MDNKTKTSMSSNQSETKPPLKPDQLIILDAEPAEITLERGPFAWCRCGKSSALPFCDGTHSGKKFMQVFYKIAEKRNNWLCENNGRINEEPDDNSDI